MHVSILWTQIAYPACTTSGNDHSQTSSSIGSQSLHSARCLLLLHIAAHFAFPDLLGYCTSLHQCFQSHFVSPTERSQCRPLCPSSPYLPTCFAIFLAGKKNQPSTATSCEHPCPCCAPKIQIEGKWETCSKEAQQRTRQPSTYPLVRLCR